MESQRKKRKDDGVSLIEIILVISIIGILAAVFVPSAVHQVNKAKEAVCWQNRLTLQEAYARHLEQEGVEHSQGIINEFIIQYEENLCPDGGEVKYVNGEMKCSVHLGVEETDEGEVPYL